MYVQVFVNVGICVCINLYGVYMCMFCSSMCVCRSIFVYMSIHVDVCMYEYVYMYRYV